MDWFASDEAVSERASHFSAAVSDISEWLIERPAPDLRPIAARVEYDAACHLLHAQKTDAVEALLSSIPELVVTHLPRSERCCGGAGIYGISQRRLSHELLKKKLEETQEAEARFVVTANPGCLMQIGAGAMTNRQSFAVVHAIEVLDEALVRL